LLLGLMTAVALAARWLRRDLRAHPANFPAPAAIQGLVATGAGGRRPRSRWSSQNRM
jgi:hypothetical protein